MVNGSYNITANQNLELQIVALKNAGCEKIYQYETGSSKVNRPIVSVAIDFFKNMIS